MSQFKKVRIESNHPVTKVFIDDVEMKGLTGMNIRFDAGKNPLLTLEMRVGELVIDSQFVEIRKEQ